MFEIIDFITSFQFVILLFGLGIVGSVVYGLYTGLGPRVFWTCLFGLVYAILWIIIMINSRDIAGRYAWILCILPGIILIIYFIVKLSKWIKEKRFSSCIDYYQDDDVKIEDAKAYKIQKRLSKLTGKKKYLYGLKRTLAETKELAFEKRVLADRSTGFEGLIFEKEANWGTKAGIAGGLFGTAAGIAVAVDEIAKTEEYNQMAREHNTRLLNSGWKPGGVKAAWEREASNLASDVNYLKSIYRSVKKAKTVFNPDEKAQLVVKRAILQTSGYVKLTISNRSECVKIGNAPASLDGTYKIKIVNSQKRVVGVAYYNPPGFAEPNLCDVGFSQAKQIQVFAAPRNGGVISTEEKYSFEFIPIKAWKIQHNFR